jgi:hypothetical protein
VNIHALAIIAARLHVRALGHQLDGFEGIADR